MICAAALASADAATKAWLQTLSATALLLVRFSLAALMLTPALVHVPPLGALAPALWGWLLLLLPLELTAMVLYLIAIRDHPLSLTLPFLAFTPAFVLLIAYGLLGETPSWSGAFGVLCIVAGAWMLNAAAADGKRWRTWLKPFQAIFWETGSRLMLIVAFIYALTATFSKAALAYLAPAQFGALYFAALGLLTLGLFLAEPLWRHRLWRGAWLMEPAADRLGAGSALAQASAPRTRNMVRAPWRTALAMVLVAALNAVMILTHFLAMEDANVAYMIAVKRTSLVFGMLYGFFWFGEPGLRQRLPAAGLMLLGVFLIATAA